MDRAKKDLSPADANGLPTVKNDNRMSRREFIKRFSAGTLILSLAPMSVFPAGGEKKPLWPKDAGKYKFYMIGHGHIDPVWLWPWHEGLSVTLSTFRSALDRMNETPDFVFTASSAQLYQWVADNAPEMFEEVRQRVKEGRWNITGGWWIEPDANMPSGESFARQGLYGQLTFERLLGVRAKSGFNPDSFGHAGTLPQILKLQGMDSYTFMRPEPHEKELPANLFWWESTDGSRVLTYRIPKGYNEEKTVNERLHQILEEKKGQPMKSYMSFYGVGDHGGGPTKITIKSIEELRKEKGAPQIVYSPVDKYFEDMRAADIDLPVIRDDMQFHAVGCYTIESAIKKGNRLSEAALVNAEKITAIGSLAWNAKYPKDDFTNAWHKVLFLQFHDSLAGSSLIEHSRDARTGYGYALETANNARLLAAQKLEWQIASEDPASKYLVVFNPHAWETESLVEFELGVFGKNPATSQVEDENGNSLPHQWIFGASETTDRNMLAVKAKIPPMGYRQLRIRKGTPAVVSNPVKITESCLENKYVKLTFASDGTLGIIDKATGEGIFSGQGCRAVVMDDPSDTWSHGIVSYPDVIGEFGDAEFAIINRGAFCSTLRATSRYGNSSLTIDWTLYSDSADLDAKVSLDWHERLKILKFSFPVNLDSATATYEAPYGFIVRETNGHEVPGHRWFDLSGTRNGTPCGFTVINDAKYGYDINGNDMHLSVARSAVYAHHNPRQIDHSKEHLWMDQGIQTFRMKLIPHIGTWREAGIPRKAEEFLTPATCVYQGIHGGKLPKSDSFMSVDASNVVISSVKLSENGDDLIVRCVEANGEQTTATIDLKIAGKRYRASFRPCEIKTLRVDKKTKQIQEVNLLEE